VADSAAQGERFSVVTVETEISMELSKSVPSLVDLLIRQCDENDRQDVPPTRREMDLLCGEIAGLKDHTTHREPNSSLPPTRWQERW
jgi:hypothetical protein